MDKVEWWYFEGCPHWRTADDRLAKLRSELGFQLSRRVVSTLEAAELLGFRGSPTIRVNGLDPFATRTRPAGRLCLPDI